MTDKEQFELDVLTQIEEHEAFVQRWAGTQAAQFHQSSEAPYPVKEGWGYHDGVDVAPEDYDPTQGMSLTEFAAYRERLKVIGVCVLWIPNADVPEAARYVVSKPDFVIDFTPENE